MSTEALVDAVVARIRNKLIAPAGNPAAKTPCDKWPSDPRASPQFGGGNTALWVGYDGSTFSAPEAADMPIQERTKRIYIALFVRNLHGVHGAADWVDAVHEVLHGWAPGGGKMLVIDRDQFGAFKDGVWRYDLVYRMTTMAVPSTDETTPGPALLRITLADAEFGDSDIPTIEAP